jgi:tetratricopeptide (TPR) repeat protein
MSIAPFLSGILLTVALPAVGLGILKKGSKDFLSLNKEKFLETIANEDQLTQAFLKMHFNEINGLKDKAFYTQALKFLEKEHFNHPLHPYLLQELIESGLSEVQTVEQARSILLATEQRSCPSRSYVLSTLQTESKNLIDNLNVIADYHSRSFKSEAYDQILSILSEKEFETHRDIIIEHIRSYRNIMQKYSRHFRTDTHQFAGILKETQARRCSEAKNVLIKIIHKEKPDIHALSPATDAIEACYRSRRIPRIRLWTDLRDLLIKTYETDGTLLAHRRIGYFHWLNDQFEAAQKMFLENLELAQSHKKTYEESLAVYTLGRIAENQNNILEAIDYYQTYAEKFPQGNHFATVEMRLVVLATLAGQHAKALTFLRERIRAENEKPIDDRTEMPFALFWAGRLYLQTGQKLLALAHWRRLAEDYYSTFYGALGQYFYETIHGQELDIFSKRVFHFPSVKETIKNDKNNGHRFARAEALLRHGFEDEARCEISEVIPQGDAEGLALTLYKHETGDWLGAIRGYDALPRSFRQKLPKDFEKVIFPRAYETDIDKYASKLDMDPDMVMALIRQESLFNPRAISSAGARGLMQLMPQTAKVEASRLSRTYVPVKEQNKIRQKAGQVRNLLEPDLNLLLGIHHLYRLLSKHDNIIFALSSYNANPTVAQRWRQNLGDDDLLAFIERIPYAETKDYVRLVLRNYYYYKKWFRPEDKKLPHFELLARNLIRGSSK